MWAAGAPSPEWPPGGGEASFAAAISRSMRVPPRLRLLGAWEGPGAWEPEGAPAALQMHVPDRLCLAEMPDAAPSGPWCPAAGDAPLALAVQAAAEAEQPFLSLASPSSSGAQRRRRPGPLSRARKERGGCPMDGPHLALEPAARQRQDWLEQSVAPGGWSRPRALPPPAPQPPLFPPGPRIYSPQNVLRALRFLGQQLVQLFRRPLPAPSPSSREVTLVLESSLEEFGPTDILALQKQLIRISGRLQALEEQSMGWRQKQLLFYSILLSACLLNVWLWLRR